MLATSQHWLLDRWTVVQSRQEDLKYVSETDIVKLNIWFCHCKFKASFMVLRIDKGSRSNHLFFGMTVIQKLAKRLQLRQQVVATAFVYFKRFYTK
jgi:cyclin C